MNIEPIVHRLKKATLRQKALFVLIEKEDEESKILKTACEEAGIKVIYYDADEHHQAVSKVVKDFDCQLVISTKNYENIKTLNPLNMKDSEVSESGALVR